MLLEIITADFISKKSKDSFSCLKIKCEFLEEWPSTWGQKHFIFKCKE